MGSLGSHGLRWRQGVRAWVLADARRSRWVALEGQNDGPATPAEIAFAVGRRLVEPLDLALAPPVKAPPVPRAIVCVYRSANATRVRRFLDCAVGARAALWALDRPHPELTERTIGSGPGTRLQLLNRLAASLEPSPSGEWLAVVDDDVTFVSGDLDLALAAAGAAGLDVSQPSHSRWSHLSWGATAHRPLSRARLVRFVEQGPVVLLSPPARARLVPFPEDIGMGWGVEVLWSSHDDLRLGIVDAVTMRHENPVRRTGGYDVDREWNQAMDVLRAHGHEDFSELQRTLATWRPWQRHAPWKPRTPPP